MTKAAKNLARQLLASAGPLSNEEATAPSKMRPSDKEDDYSFVSDFKNYPLLVSDSAGSFQTQWCSLCADRNTEILLCAGCRIGVCVQSIDERHSGCLMPDAAQRLEGFVFLCPYCCKRKTKKFPVSVEFIRKELWVNCL